MPTDSSYSYRLVTDAGSVAWAHAASSPLFASPPRSIKLSSHRHRAPRTATHRRADLVGLSVVAAMVGPVVGRRPSGRPEVQASESVPHTTQSRSVVEPASGETVADSCCDPPLSHHPSPHPSIHPSTMHHPSCPSPGPLTPRPSPSPVHRQAEARPFCVPTKRPSKRSAAVGPTDWLPHATQRTPKEGPPAGAKERAARWFLFQVRGGLHQKRVGQCSGCYFCDATAATDDQRSDNRQTSDARRNLASRSRPGCALLLAVGVERGLTER